MTCSIEAILDSIYFLYFDIDFIYNVQYFVLDELTFGSAIAATIKWRNLVLPFLTYGSTEAPNVLMIFHYFMVAATTAAPKFGTKKQRIFKSVD